MTPALPRSGWLAWWLTAWLRGHEPTDHLLDALALDAHLVDGQPGLLQMLARVRGTGTDGAGLALPVEGDPVGLGGPRPLNDAALEVGEAVVAGPLAFVPSEAGEVVSWQAFDAERRQLPDVGEADRTLRTALLDAAKELAALDVARWRPEVADELMDLRRPLEVVGPPGIPGRCLDLAARGAQALAIVELALEDDGAALTAYEAEQRRTALRPLERAGRRALVAACSPEAWPDRPAVSNG